MEGQSRGRRRRCCWCRASRTLAWHPALPPPLRPAPLSSPGAEGDDGRAWQPYADHLAYAALLALPWGGHELAESVPGELAALMEAVEGYMAARPRASQPSLRPFAAAIKEDDPVAE